MVTLSNFTPPRDRSLSFWFIRDRPLSVWLHFKWITYVGILDDWAMQKSKKLKIILANMIDCFKVLFVSSEQNHSFYTLFQPFSEGVQWTKMRFDWIIWVRHIIALPFQVFLSACMIKLGFDSGNTDQTQSKWRYQLVLNVHQLTLNQISL